MWKIWLLCVLVPAVVKCRSFERLIKKYVMEEKLLFQPQPQGSNGDQQVQHWALLVAGSNGWYNYRHQADVCHAFQVLKNHGIPEKNIVVMMYDDIANNVNNPTPGVIINHPNGSDVYDGVPKDYTAEDVTPDNFLKILQGESMIDQNGKTIGSGKVIASGPKDHIFVNFVDHGAPGIVAFPDDELSAKRWNKVIQKMHRQKKYGQMVIYVEACESGSMFNKLLPDDINVFVTTASSPTQSSYACYYDDDRHTYLGDVYSVRWMEDSDKETLTQETLQKQYLITKKKTNTSIVEEYGDMTISKEKVAEFQGNMKLINPSDVPKITYPDVPLDAVPGPDVPLAILRHRLAKAKSTDEEEKINQELKEILDRRQEIAQLFKKIVAAVVNHRHKDVENVLGQAIELTNHDCYEPAMRHFHDHCMNIAKNDYALRFLYTFVNLCEKGHSTDAIVDAIEKVCH